MTRSVSRLNAFFLIFQIPFYDSYEPGAQFKLYCDDKKCVLEKDRAFISDRLNGVFDNLIEIDGVIKGNLSGWEIDRIARADLAAIRLAVYEMLIEGKTPLKVSVNEAVEIAKNYGTDDSGQFVNGILRSVYELASNRPDDANADG